MLLGENQLLRSKLKDSEKLNDTLRNENNLFSKIQSQSSQTPATSQKRSTTDELLAGFMAEMRELRLRLEDSIRTNDALRAQLEMRLSEGTGDKSAGSVPDKIILIRENDTLRTELLEKNRANEKLKRIIDGLKQEQTRWVRVKSFQILLSMNFNRCKAVYFLDRCSFDMSERLPFFLPSFLLSYSSAVEHKTL